MTAWRSLVILTGVLVWTGTVRAQTYPLQEKGLAGSHFQIHLKMDLKGELIIQQEGKEAKLPQVATADHEYVERILQEGEQEIVGKAARFYKSAKAVITVGKGQSERSLRPERCLMVAQHTKDALLTFCPKGPLTHDELDLTRHFDTLAIPGLLPQKAIAIGDSWKLANPVAQALCSFDGLTSHSLTCTLVSVNDKKATVALNGHAGGIDSGATVNLEIKGSFKFDLEAGRVVSLTWTQKDERDQGPVSPAMKAEVNIQLTRTPVDAAAEVNDFALVPSLDWKLPPESVTALSYTDPKGSYTLAPTRDWIIVARTGDHLVMRLLDRGEFVAQATVVRWTKAEAGKHMSAEEFKKAMSEAPGWQQEELKEAKELGKVNGNWVYRMEADGKLNGLKTKQYFYLLASPEGDQVVLAFTLTPNQVSKLGDREENLYRSVAFPAVQKKE